MEYKLRALALGRQTLLGIATVALAFSQAHMIIDWSVGLYGQTSASMAPIQAFLIATLSVLVGWWSFVFTSAGSWEKSGLVSLFVFCFGWSFFGNGVAGVVGCPPPCSNAFPYQDIAHFGNIIFGGLSAYYLRKAVKETPGAIQWRTPLVSVIVLLLPVVAEGAMALARVG